MKVGVKMEIDIDENSWFGRLARLYESTDSDNIDAANSIVCKALDDMEALFVHKDK